MALVNGKLFCGDVPSYKNFSDLICGIARQFSEMCQFDAFTIIGNIIYTEVPVQPQ